MKELENKNSEIVEEENPAEVLIKALESMSNEEINKAVKKGTENKEDASKNEEKKESDKNAHQSKRTNAEKKIDDFIKDLGDIALLLDTSTESLRDEFMLAQVRKVMSRVQKVIVRYDVPEAELDKILEEAEYLQMGGLTVAPIYIPTCAKNIKKSKFAPIKLGAVIDFPFGESTFKGKLADFKVAKKSGAEQISVSFPAMQLSPEKLKEFKKQVKTLGKIHKGGAGVIFNASDIETENFIEAVKIISKTKISFITLAFGDASIEQVKQKIAGFNEFRPADKKLFVLANVEHADSIMELFKLKVDSILTPYADAIGRYLIERFNLNN